MSYTLHVLYTVRTGLLIAHGKAIFIALFLYVSPYCHYRIVLYRLIYYFSQ